MNDRAHAPNADPGVKCPCPGGKGTARRRRHPQLEQCPEKPRERERESRSDASRQRSCQPRCPAPWDAGGGECTCAGRRRVWPCGWTRRLGSPRFIIARCGGEISRSLAVAASVATAGRVVGARSPCLARARARAAGAPQGKGRLELAKFKIPKLSHRMRILFVWSIKSRRNRKLIA